MASTRLPAKPLADIAGLPMIVRVWQQAQAAGLGPVVVAAGEAQIVDIIKSHGGEAVLTDPDLPSGSGRRCRPSTPRASTMWWSTCRAICPP